MVKMEKYYAVVSIQNDFTIVSTMATKREEAEKNLQTTYSSIVTIVSQSKGLDNLKKRLKKFPEFLTDADKYILKVVCKSKSQYLN
jgi:hypothetical protein